MNEVDSSSRQYDSAVPSSETLEHQMQLAPGVLRELGRCERLVVSALVPGQIVPRAKLLRTRLDAGAGAAFTETALRTIMTQARKKLERATGGSRGIARVRGRGLYLWSEDAGDWFEVGPLRFSRIGLVAEIDGPRHRLTVQLAFLLEPLARCAARDSTAYVSSAELDAIIDPVSPPGGRVHGVKASVEHLRQATGLRIDGVGGSGYQLVLPETVQERQEP